MHIIDEGESLELERGVVIPLGRPEIIIEAPYPRTALPKGNLSFRAVPYFFNIADLTHFVLTWSANGERVTGGGDLNQITLDTSAAESGGRLTLEARGVNTKNEFEFAEHALYFTVQ